MDNQIQDQFETLSKEEIIFNRKSFIEIARKRINDSEVICISKGFVDPSGFKRYKNSVGFPAHDDKVKNFILETLGKI